MDKILIKIIIFLIEKKIYQKEWGCNLIKFLVITVLKIQELKKILIVSWLLEYLVITVIINAIFLIIIFLLKFYDIIDSIYSSNCFSWILFFYEWIYEWILFFYFWFTLIDILIILNLIACIIIIIWNIYKKK